MIYDFGAVPLSNNYNLIDKYDLKLTRCSNCSLIQTVPILDPKLMFSDYSYLSSASEPLKEHFRSIKNTIESLIKLKNHHLVVDIGCNDGSFLENFPSNRRVGVDPSSQSSSILKQKEIPSIQDFLTHYSKCEVLRRFGKAKLIIASHVLAHTSNPNEMVKIINNMLLDDGLLVIEVDYLKSMFDLCSYDQIYHEHQCYFSFLTLNSLLERNGFYVEKVSIESIQGESLLVFCKKTKPRIRANIEEFGLNSFFESNRFSSRIDSHRSDFGKIIANLKNEGKKIIGYGAPAKATNLIHHCHIQDHIDFVVDSTPLKYGKNIPSTKIPIFPESHINNSNFDYAILFSWNYRDWIIKKEAELLKKCRFIIPFPNIEII
jgi:hypothetical protein